MKNGWCQENGQPLPNKRNQGDSDNDEPKRKLKRTDSYKDVEDNEGYLNLWKRTKVRGEDKYNQLYDQCVSNGEAERDTKQLAKARMEVYDRRKFMDLYSELLGKLPTSTKNKQYAPKDSV